MTTEHPATKVKIMSAALDKFLFQNPSFIVKNREKSRFRGSIEVNKECYHVEIFAPKFPSTVQLTCRLLHGISEIDLTDFDTTKNSKDVFNYINELRSFLQNNPPNRQPPFSTISVTTFLDQLRSLRSGRPCKVAINRNYDRIKITEFESYPEHYLELSIATDLTVKVENHSLPDTDTSDNNLFSVSGSLQVVVTQFWRLLEQFEEFYNNLNTIDELCIVVEPVAITTKHNWRIFRMTDKILAKVVVDPFAPSAIILNFFGPTTEVENYREIYSENISRWDADLDIYRNLLRIFDLMYFPMRKVGYENATDEEKYCNICYTYINDNHVPIISCDNTRCDLIFHVSCLKEWFNTLKDGKTFLTVTIGNCPFCKEKLSPSFVQLLEQ